MAGDIVKPTDIVNAEQLQQLLGKRNGPGLLFLAVHLATLATSGGLLFLSLGSGWMLPALVLHGIIVVHLFGPFHESSHGTAFRSDWLNKAMGWFSGLVLFLIPHHFRYEHLAHHSYTQNVDEDPQMIPSAERLGGYLFYATAIPYFISNGRIMTRIMLGRLNPMERHFIPKREQAKVIRQARIMWMVYLAAAGLSFGLGSSFLWTYWLLPRLAGEPAMWLVRMSEHTGCPRVNTSSATLARCSPGRRCAGWPGTWPTTPSTTRCRRRPSSPWAICTACSAATSPKSATAMPTPRCI